MYKTSAIYPLLLLEIKSHKQVAHKRWCETKGTSFPYTSGRVEMSETPWREVFQKLSF